METENPGFQDESGKQLNNDGGAVNGIQAVQAVENVAIPLEEIDIEDSISFGKKGSVITYHHVSYTVKVKPQDKKCACGTVDKEILHSISGIFKPGMNAIMGPTGGGKSSLLDVLAGRKNPAGLSGAVLVDGKRQPPNFNRLAGYVVQEDIVMGTLTVKENIMFSANLRLSNKLSQREKVERVDDIIRELGLTKCANTRVGTEFIRGVSGGEKKRTSIGMEMIVSPNILFLDEPTTGLDAFTAKAVMSLLHNLSLNGRTIIFSIHQPRYSIFKLFHRLTLLADGCTVYHGPADEALEHFSSIGYNCDDHDNPSDFFLDVIKESFDKEEDEGEDDVVAAVAVDMSKERPKKTGTNGQEVVQAEKSFTLVLSDKYKKSRWSQKVDEELKNYPIPVHDKHMSMKRFFTDKYSTSFFTQCKYVAGRLVKNIIRSPQTTMSQLIVNIMFAIIIGLIFLKLDNKKDFISVAIQNRAGALFFITVNQIFSNMASLDLFIRERALFIHENGSGFYRTSAYFFSKLFCDVIPLKFIPVTAFGILTYFMIGFIYEAKNFFIFYFCIMLTTISASSISFAISASVDNTAIGSLFLSMIYVLMLLFGGFLSNVKSMGDWLSWLSYFSIVRYSVNIQYINQLSNGKINYITANSTEMQYDYEVGNEYLTNLNIDHGTPYDLGKNFIALICITVIMMTVTYIKLRTIQKYK